MSDGQAVVKDADFNRDLGLDGQDGGKNGFPGALMIIGFLKLKKHKASTYQLTIARW